MIAEAGGDGVLLVGDVIVADAIQFAGRDTGFDVRGDHLQHLGGQSAGDAHFFDFFRGFN